jgi:hypothetical protein
VRNHQQKFPSTPHTHLLVPVGSIVEVVAAGPLVPRHDGDEAAGEVLAVIRLPGRGRRRLLENVEKGEKDEGVILSNEESCDRCGRIQDYLYKK